jgi:hypothetical protein
LKAILDANAVVTSTSVLEKQLAGVHSHVTTIHNVLPPRMWRAVCERTLGRTAPATTGRLTIGYIGTASHQPDLLSIEDALIEVLRGADCRVGFLSVGVPLSMRLSTLPNVRQVYPPAGIRRDYARFPEYAASLPIDIGIAPLTNNLFNRCKSDIKYQEYAAIGVPSVYTSIDPYRDRVRCGVTGLLADSRDEWITQLQRLIADAALRENIRQQAVREIHEQWRGDSRAVAYREVIEQARELAQSPGSTGPHQYVGEVVDDILSYQIILERRLKRTVEYQVAKGVSRLVSRLAKRLHRAAAYLRQAAC